MERLVGYEIIEHEVRDVIEITTQSGKTYINKVHSKEYGFSKKINISIDKSIIFENEIASINFKWTKFDLIQKKHIEDLENQMPFKVEINEVVYEVPISETVEFSSEEAGEYIIRTANELVGNTEVRVVVVDEN